jgi:hypothetical protein
MADNLASILLSFQPDSPELEKRREYDSRARSFVSQLSTISPSHWTKGADTQQDVLTVRRARGVSWGSTDCTDTEPRRQLNSIRLRSPSPHRPRHREEARTGAAAARRPTVEPAHTVFRDSRSCAAAVRRQRVEDTGGVDGADCARVRSSTSNICSTPGNGTDWHSQA